MASRSVSYLTDRLHFYDAGHTDLLTLTQDAHDPMKFYIIADEKYVWSEYEKLQKSDTAKYGPVALPKLTMQSVGQVSNVMQLMTQKLAFATEAVFQFDEAYTLAMEKKQSVERYLEIVDPEQFNPDVRTGVSFTFHDQSDARHFKLRFF